jgi:RNA polymerase sigma factor (sigma-70 family)
MAKGTAGAVRRHIDRLVGRRNDSQVTDRELLQRFTEQQDESAFEALFRRHGAMVLAVGRRALGNSQDAEDVCQAAFLLLAKKAASERWQRSVANWLYRTAHLLALKTRTAATRRARNEGRATPRSPANPLAEITGQELLAALDEELLRLPQPLRAPLVLCYLAGATRDEAAQRLGCPLATLKNRLERGRAQLHAALVRRGLGLSTVLLGTLLTQQTANAAATIALAGKTAQAALAVAAGQAVDGIVSAEVSQLVKGGLGITCWNRFTSGLALLLTAGLLWTAGALAYSTGEDRPIGRPPKAAPAPEDKKADRPATAPGRVQGTTLRYQFKKGDKFRYVVETKKETKTTAAGNERVVSTTQTYDMIWMVRSVDANGNVRITQTIHRIRFLMDSGIAGKIEFDSSKDRKPKGPGSQVLADFFKALVGAEFTWTMSPRGEVSDFKAPERILNVLKKTRGLGPTFSPDSFKQRVTQGMIVLPRGPVINGGSWTQKADAKIPVGPAKMTAYTRALYQGKIDRGGKKLEAIALEPAATIDRAAGAFGQATLKNQEGKGRIFFDNDKGRLVQTERSQTLDMETTTGGQTIVWKIKLGLSATLAPAK